MAEGPYLPRKDTALRRSREALEGVAYQIGVLLAIQRNRYGLTQWDLAGEISLKHQQAGQLAISNAEKRQALRSHRRANRRAFRAP